MRQNPGFTLVEVLVAVALTGIILLAGYSAFQKIMQAQSRLGAAIDVQKNLFYTNEKLAALIREGGTIDYEEYFNRRMLGYARSKRTLDNVFTFTNYSHFGNGNIASKPPIYYCGVDTSVISINEGTCLTNTGGGSPTGYVSSSTSAPFLSPFLTGHKSYGQYAALALNYADPVGFPMPIKLPPVFKTGGELVSIFTRSPDNRAVDKDPLNVGLPELYLIKRNLNNSYTRTYFRHVYVQDPFPGTPNCDPTTSIGITGCLGKIQMTKLKECDNLLANGSPGNDGIIDAWIPTQDFYIGTDPWTCGDIVPNTASIYTAAHEETITTPSLDNPNLKWVDVTAPDMNVIRATFLPNPLKIPALMSGAGDPAQSPSVSVYLEVQLSTKLRNKSFVRTNMNYPRTLITTYDLSE